MPEPGRRTQQERKAATRAALLEAALSCLMDRGFAHFTTTEVAHRAGTSQGSVFKHFPSKSVLLAATIEYLFDGLRSSFSAAFASVPAGERTVARALDLLWEQMLDERLGAAYDLYGAAWTDRDLRAALEPVMSAHIDRLVDLARSVGEGAGLELAGESFEALAGVAILGLQGLRLNQMVRPDPDEVADTLRVLRRLIEVGAAPAPPGRK
ncbi:MAG: TetR/AcrR family transcriptional regulator [Actinomycetota bacterium]|nr:TetR/AcrR family transcriptional regulator [Actinomycetota bacterium]